MPKPIITVIRPNLSREEREKRLAEIKAAMVAFWQAKETRR